MKKKIKLMILLLFTVFAIQQMKAQSDNIKPYYKSYGIDYLGKKCTIVDAVNYRGDIYVLLSVPFTLNSELRIVKTKKDNDRLVLTENYTYVTAGPTGASKAVEWKDHLIVFYGNEFVHSAVGVYDKDLKSTFYDDKFSNFDINNIGVTVMNDYLYCFYKENKTSKIKVMRTVSNKDLNVTQWQDMGYVLDGKNDNIKFGKFGEDSDESFDVITWHGMINNERCSRIIFGRVHGGKLSAYTYDGKDWEPYVEGAAAYKSKAFNLKLLQGSLRKNTTPSNKNSVLFFYATKEPSVAGEIHCQDYDPESKRFFTEDFYTDLPYGSFGVVCDYVQEKPGVAGTDSVEYLRQYNYIFRGTKKGHYPEMFVGRMESNRIKRTTQVYECSANPGSLTRECCTLYGIIEGAPPTLIDSDEWFENLFEKTFLPATTLSLNKSQTKGVVTSETGDSGITTVMGKDDGFFGGSIAFQKSFSETATKEITINTTTVAEFKNKSCTEQNTGYQVIGVPTYRREDLEMLSPENIKMKGAPFFSVIKEIGSTIHFNEINLAKCKDAFNIQDPTKLSNWETSKRNKFNRKPSYYDSKILSANTYIKGPRITQTWGKEEHSIKNNIKNTLLTAKMNVPFFKIEGNFGYSINRTSSTIITSGVSFILENIPENTIPAGYIPPIKRYTLNMYFIEGGSLMAKDLYYEGLLKCGLMFKGEEPWILAWDVTGLSNTSPAMPKGLNSETDQNYKIKTQVYSSGGYLYITTFPNAFIRIIDISQKVYFAQVVKSSEFQIQLPMGMYIISDGVNDPIKAMVN